MRPLEIMTAAYKDAITEQLTRPLLLLPKRSGLAPLYGPPKPALLVRDLIKRLQACDPEAWVYYEDYEYGPCRVMEVLSETTEHYGAGEGKVMLR